jgi:hypothetical protein
MRLSTQKARAPPKVKMPAVCRINREQGFDSGRITSPSDHPSACRSAITLSLISLVRGFSLFAGSDKSFSCSQSGDLYLLPFLVFLLPDKSTEALNLS